mmetsp:Transcript_14883/g.38185  ORF Transcript_14883/g.38185 Transcript_14883/m.38185 type:complete len:239 (+) Transcript_14883:731-1447(+)
MEPYSALSSWRRRSSTNASARTPAGPVRPSSAAVASRLSIFLGACPARSSNSAHFPSNSRHLWYPHAAATTAASLTSVANCPTNTSVESGDGGSEPTSSFQVPVRGARAASRFFTGMCVAPSRQLGSTGGGQDAQTAMMVCGKGSDSTRRRNAAGDKCAAKRLILRDACLASSLRAASERRAAARSRRTPHASSVSTSALVTLPPTLVMAGIAPCLGTLRPQARQVCRGMVSPGCTSE